MKAPACRCTLEGKRLRPAVADDFGICASGRIVVDQGVEAIRAWPMLRRA
ncbi:hypothetical protein DM82_1591 [Burkholderia oklahomensis]|uniref:Uncharacterized protein n=1 Tax=Burkholderia oklahomensis TaxID=342113 RepID=A0AAI8B5K0_9BURK|nr:hypothetical protein DM82_1591 [Burkholderia oklahomensis]